MGHRHLPRGRSRAPRGAQRCSALLCHIHVSVIPVSHTPSPRDHSQGWREADCPKVRIASVGKGTSRVLEGGGLRPLFTPSKANAETLAGAPPPALIKSRSPASTSRLMSLKTTLWPNEQTLSGPVLGPTPTLPQRSSPAPPAAWAAGFSTRPPPKPGKSSRRASAPAGVGSRRDAFYFPFAPRAFSRNWLDRARRALSPSFSSPRALP